MSHKDGFPQTRDELVYRGYKFLNVGTCRGCHAQIEWYETPIGKKIPMDYMQEGTSPAKAHWATCPNSQDFRKGK